MSIRYQDHLFSYRMQSLSCVILPFIDPSFSFLCSVVFLSCHSHASGRSLTIPHSEYQNHVFPAPKETSLCSPSARVPSVCVEIIAPDQRQICAESSSPPSSLHRFLTAGENPNVSTPPSVAAAAISSGSLFFQRWGARAVFPGSVPCTVRRDGLDGTRWTDSNSSQPRDQQNAGCGRAPSHRLHRLGSQLQDTSNDRFDQTSLGQDAHTLGTRNSLRVPRRGVCRPPIPVVTGRGIDPSQRRGKDKNERTPRENGRERHMSKGTRGSTRRDGRASPPSPLSLFSISSQNFRPGTSAMCGGRVGGSFDGSCGGNQSAPRLLEKHDGRNFGQRHSSVVLGRSLDIGLSEQDGVDSSREATSHSSGHPQSLPGIDRDHHSYRFLSSVQDRFGHRVFLPALRENSLFPPHEASELSPPSSSGSFHIDSPPVPPSRGGPFSLGRRGSGGDRGRRGHSRILRDAIPQTDP
mmetsp:Transcript_42774/g.110297  ORF Transcript_42774/g.110297 Transcript_42774/m.110297 type:complete len:465 (-) Transcript_42774:304-1698(-)